jgi:hypothetical protein
MATHQLAQGLASLGRHGDSMLMHVSPAEVEGLSALGKMTGHKLHTNPRTGMPEAFDFGDFFTSLIPTLVGAALAPATGGASLGLTGMAATAAPVLGGMAAGAAVAGAKGDDPLMGGLMGGLGGYGGGNLAGTFGKMGSAAAPASSNIVLDQAAGQGIKNIGSVQPGVQLAKDVGMNAPLASDQFATSLVPNLPSANVLAGQPASTVASSAGGIDDVLSGVKQLGSDPFGAGYDAFKQAGGSAFDLAAPIGMAGLAGAQEDLYPKGDNSLEEKRKAEENKYRDPITGRLNLAQASPGLRLATGGTVNTNSSTISSGGIQDLYGTNDQTTGTQNLSKEGYGIGRLNSLAAEGSRAKAADTFYAAGGPIAFAEGGSSNIYIPGYNLPSFSQGSLGGNPLFALLAQLFAKQGLSNAQANTSTSAAKAPTPTTISPMNEPGMYPQASNDYMATKATDKGTFALEAAKGGYLNGHGDGMSDSIPATIEGKQPARLADGEFVIPADVVSHIGNGSSKAGSKQLYSMLDRIRKARTGHTKQGKEIKPQKYMPA